eukprot:SAG31_NODE_147_length_22539_cov_37.073663_9_plen_89_part_00
MREAEARSEFFGQGKRMSAMAGTGQHLQSETALELNKFLSEHQGDQHTLAAIGTRKAQGLSWKPSVPVRCLRYYDFLLDLLPNILYDG